MAAEDWRKKERRRTPLARFIKSTWSNLNIRCGNGRYRQHMQTRSKSKSYDSVMIEITRAEFKAWCESAPQRDAIETMHRPSLDRVDRAKGYSLTNMRIVPLAYNIAKEKVISTDGCCVCYKCQQWKSLDEFAVDNRRLLTGRTTCCKRCDGIRRYARHTPPLEALVRDMTNRIARFYEPKDLAAAENVGNRQ
jgi:hypothetical protein